MPLRIAMIGAGPFNRARHAPVLHKLAQAAEPRISLEAVCDLDAEKAARYASEFGFQQTFADLHQMVKEVEPDAVYVLVPPGAAAHVLSQVLPYGLPTFTEKPPAMTVADAQRVAELADQHGQITYVAFNRRCTPAMVRLKGWMDANGPVRYIHASMLRTRRREPDFATGTAIHALDALRFLAGDVESIETRAVRYGKGEHRDFHVRLAFTSGVVADLDVIVDCGMQRERYVVYTEGKIAEATVPGGYSSPHFHLGFRVHEERAVAVDERAIDDPIVACGFQGEHEAFLDAIERGERPGCCLQDAQHSVRLAAAVHEAHCVGLADEAM